MRARFLEVFRSRSIPAHVEIDAWPQHPGTRTALLPPTGFGANGIAFCRNALYIGVYAADAATAIAG